MDHAKECKDVILSGETEKRDQENEGNRIWPDTFGR